MLWKVIEIGALFATSNDMLDATCKLRNTHAQYSQLIKSTFIVSVQSLYVISHARSPAPTTCIIAYFQGAGPSLSSC